jgi:hypothetical protein
LAETGIQEITGSGEFLFEAAHHITFIQFFTDVPTSEVDYRSLTRPRRQLHAGWIALASGDLGVPSDESALNAVSVTWSSYFEFESNLIVEPSKFDYDDRVQYNIPVGITAKFNALW